MGWLGWIDLIEMARSIVAVLRPSLACRMTDHCGTRVRTGVTGMDRLRTPTDLHRSRDRFVLRNRPDLPMIARSDRLAT